MRGTLDSTWPAAPLLLAAAFLSLRCDSLMPALGSYDTIHVVSDESPPDDVMEALRGALAIPFETVQEETLFRLAPVAFRDLDEVPNRKNYLLLVDLSDRGPTFHLARRLLGRKALDRAARSGKPTALFVDDAFARQQAHAVLLAPDAPRLAEAARAKGKTIRDGFLRSIRRRILAFLVFRGEKESLARKIQRRYGWYVRMPAPFAVDLGRMDDGFFSMKMDRPGRLFFAYWRDAPKRLPEPEAVIALRDSVGRLYYDEDYVEPERTRAFRADFQGRPAIRVQGLWQNEKYTIGGPFRSIAFIDEASGRLFLLDYAVYAPGYSKKYYLWELESVLETFRVGPPPEEKPS